MAEIYNLRPLFPGSSESDQLYKTCLVLGTPTKENGLWPEGVRLAAQLGYRFPTSAATPLWQLMPQANEEAISLLDGMLQWEPNKRLSTGRILAHPYFETGYVSHAPPNGPTATPSGEGSAHSRVPALPAQPSGDWLATLSSTPKAAFSIPVILALAARVLPQERTTHCRHCSKTADEAMVAAVVVEHKKRHTTEVGTCSRWPDTSLASKQHLVLRCPCCLPYGKATMCQPCGKLAIMWAVFLELLRPETLAITHRCQRSGCRGAGFLR